jgi:hypothetical protein
MPVQAPLRTKYNRRTSWVVTGLESAVMLFLAGLFLLHLNPFWHFDESGLLDWRVHWWNVAAQVLMAAGLFAGALAAIALVAMLVSRMANRRAWPYLVVALLVGCAVVWVSLAGFTRTVDAHFEWNIADGFEVFRLQTWDDSAGAWREADSPLWKLAVKSEIQPLLLAYFKLNDWQKMNGSVSVKVVRILPVAWPVALGSGGETLEDPDETELMRAAGREDSKAVQQLLAAQTKSNVNALDQSGQTALILACQNPKADTGVVKALLAAGADVNLRSRTGYTALTWAQARNNSEVIRLLRRAGGRP